MSRIIKNTTALFSTPTFTVCFNFNHYDVYIDEEYEYLTPQITDMYKKNIIPNTDDSNMNYLIGLYYKVKCDHDNVHKYFDKTTHEYVLGYKSFKFCIYNKDYVNMNKHFDTFKCTNFMTLFIDEIIKVFFNVQEYLKLFEMLCANKEYCYVLQYLNKSFYFYILKMKKQDMKNMTLYMHELNFSFFEMSNSKKLNKKLSKKYKNFLFSIRHNPLEKYYKIIDQVLTDYYMSLGNYFMFLQIQINVSIQDKIHFIFENNIKFYKCFTIKDMAEYVIPRMNKIPFTTKNKVIFDIYEFIYHRTNFEHSNLKLFEHFDLLNNFTFCPISLEENANYLTICKHRFSYLIFDLKTCPLCRHDLYYVRNLCNN